jgi:phospholipid-transporting ATPase
MQMIGVISISGGLPTIYLPLIFIIFLTALKDIWEDYKRKKSDKEENHSKCRIWNTDSQNF